MISYQGANWRFPNCRRKPFEKHDVSLSFINVPIKPYTSNANHLPHCCHCRAKKNLLPSNFFFLDRISPPIRRGLKLRQTSDATRAIGCRMSIQHQDLPPAYMIIVLFCWLGRRCCVEIISWVPESYIIRVSLVVVTGVSLFSPSLLLSHTAWSSAPAHIILEVSSSHLS